MRVISIEAYRASIRIFYNKLKYFANAQSVVSIECGNVLTNLLFLFYSLLYLPRLLHGVFVFFYIGNI